MKSYAKDLLCRIHLTCSCNHNNYIGCGRVSIFLHFHLRLYVCSTALSGLLLSLTITSIICYVANFYFLEVYHCIQWELSLLCINIFGFIKSCIHIIADLLGPGLMQFLHPIRVVQEFMLFLSLWMFHFLVLDLITGQDIFIDLIRPTFAGIPYVVSPFCLQIVYCCSSGFHWGMSH